MAGISARSPNSLIDKITVVMPGRNEAASVDEAVESLFAQTRLPDEIILADGCSTDGTADLFMKHSGRGIPMKVVRNEAIYVGGGRNIGARTAQHELVAHMDFGNRADERWLESMVKPFEDDPTLDYLGGIYLPRIDGRFERVCATVVFFFDTMAMTMTREEIESAVGDQLETSLPGGMCMAYRRDIWQRAGGFAEWAKRGQDRLFGLRVRHLEGKISTSLDPIIHFNMPSSVRGLYLHRFRYGLWEARLGLPRDRFKRLFRWYACAAVILAAIGYVAWQALVPAIVVLAVGYTYRVAWRNLDRIAQASGQPFEAGSRLLACAILFARDAGILLGNILGTLDRFARPRWRRMVRSYIEEGK